MSKTIIVCATISMFVFVAAFVVLSWLHVDTASLGAFLVMVIGNSVPAFGALIKTHQVDQKVDTVLEHTNGPLTETVERIKNIEQKMEDN